jgi:hypothetical protein
MSLQIMQCTATSDHVVDIETGIEKLFGAAISPESSGSAGFRCRAGQYRRT